MWNVAPFVLLAMLVPLLGSAASIAALTAITALAALAMSEILAPTSSTGVLAIVFVPMWSFLAVGAMLAITLLVRAVAAGRALRRARSETHL